MKGVVLELLHELEGLTHRCFLHRPGKATDRGKGCSEAASRPRLQVCKARHAGYASDAYCLGGLPINGASARKNKDVCSSISTSTPLTIRSVLQGRYALRTCRGLEEASTTAPQNLRLLARRSDHEDRQLGSERMNETDGGRGDCSAMLAR